VKKWIVVAALIAGASCKQGRGERCQITTDCQDPLVCSQATGTCTDMTTGGIDATIPDAPQDSPVDTPTD
jgi:hypothetical protein